jgi:Mg2+ and Co2+ transporter CorA
MEILGVFLAIFLPPSLVDGIFCMNSVNMPDARKQHNSSSPSVAWRFC